MALLRHCLETLRARERETQTRTFVGMTVKTFPLAKVAPEIDELERLMLRPASSASTADASSSVARRKAA